MAGKQTGTMKFVELVAVLHATCTVRVPDVAADGTVTVIEVAVLDVTVPVVPLNFTILLAGVELKLVPLMVTEVLALPKGGLNDATVGAFTNVKMGVHAVPKVDPFRVAPVAVALFTTTMPAP